MTLKVALVGCGKIADGHVEEIQKLPTQAHVVAVCDREILMAEQMATRYGIPSHYDSYETMLERERPDVVHITTPRLALDAGPHTYVATDRDTGGRVDLAIVAASMLTNNGLSFLLDYWESGRVNSRVPQPRTP